MPELSVVIPTLNEENYLGRLLDSIDEQVFSDYEVLVVDSGSTDSTREIARRNDCKILKTEAKGHGHARNRGAEAAKGGKLLFIDADVKLSKSKAFGNVVESLESENTVVGSSSWIPIDGSFWDRLGMWVGSLEHEIKDTLKLFPKEGTGNFLFIERKIFEKIGGFDEELPYYEDVDLIRRATKYGDADYLRRQVKVSCRRENQEGFLKTGLKYRIPKILYFLGRKDLIKRMEFETAD